MLLSKRNLRPPMNVPVVMKIGTHQHGRKRKVDAQHGIDVVEFAGRGYSVWVKDPLTWWSVSIAVWKGKEDKPVFVNQPEGTVHSLQWRPYRGTEDGRLIDGEPDWLEILRKHVMAALPEDTHYSGDYDDQPRSVV